MALRPEPVAGIDSGLSRFCGRRRELAQLRELLTTDRLVTVTGTGGIGKTRLVMEVGRAATFDFPDGVWVVELARIESADLVPTRIAEAIDAPRDGRATPLERALRVLRQGRQLLVLDNCEHVLAGAGEAAWDLLTECHGLRVLATSRAALGVRGERVWPLLPLRLPEGSASVDPNAMTDAVEMFCDRAGLLVGDGVLTQETAMDVGEICRRLDGIPLAIELAAAWVPVLSLRQVAQRLDDSLAMLQRDAVGRPQRHHSIRASLDWSSQLLTDAQRSAFARLSVFVGGFSLEGAEAVLADSDREAGSALELVASLVARSLVSADTSADEARYRLLEPVRQYAAEQLHVRPDEAHEIRRRHLVSLADLAQRAEEPTAGGPDAPWLRRLDQELANIRVALDWGFTHEPEVAARLTAALLMFCTHRPLYDEGTSWAVRAAAHSTGRTRARALLMAGWYTAERGDAETATGYLDEAARVVSEGRWRFETVMVLHAQSLVAYVRGDLATMWSLGDEGLRIARASGDDVDLMWAVWSPAVCLAVRGDNQRALALFSEGLGIATRLDNHAWRASLVCNVIETAVELGDMDTAAQHLRTALRSASVDDPSVVVYLIESAAIIAICRGQHGPGLRLLGASRASLTRSGYRETPDELAKRQHWIDAARAGIGAAEADVAWSEGLAMAARDAAAEALVVVDPAATDSTTPSPAASAGTTGEPDAPGNAFVREGQYWSLAFGAKDTRVRDSKGVRDIARLLATPGRGVAAVDLVAVDQGHQSGAAGAAVSGLGLAPEGDAGDVLDATAREQYRMRLLELEEDITEADAANDLERASRARDERRFLAAELGAAVGLGGRPRRALDPAERARKAVTWRIRDSINQIEKAHPPLGRHLRHAVRTGSLCVYDPDQATEWRL
jgi:predicted ATPase